jgi:two-component system sensor kinase FixL
MLTRGEVRQERVELARLIEEAKSIALVGAQLDGVGYSQDVDPAIAVKGDPIQIQQVLINLLRNAIEAMADSSPRHLSISVRAADGLAEVQVADSGPGIPEERRGTLFEPFVSTKPSGMGIGLSICRTIVESHGGRISAGERDGGGAVIAFTLPLA